MTMAVVKIQDRYMVVLNEQDFRDVQDVLFVYRMRLIQDARDDMSTEARESLTQMVDRLSDLKAKFTGAYVID